MKDVSRTAWENFIRCKRCFYLERKLKIKPIRMPGYPINSRVDTLLKTEFDIVIDDGRHTPEANALTFKSIAPFLKPNGIYYIEDIWPIDQMTKPDLKNLGFDFKKQIAWAQKYRKNEFTKGKWTMFINTLKGYKIEKFDHRKRCKLLDSYIYKITK